MGSSKNINPKKATKKAPHPAHASYNNYWWCLVHKASLAEFITKIAVVVVVVAECNE
jgi:hypothetical protein